VLLFAAIAVIVAVAAWGMIHERQADPRPSDGAEAAPS
jgi:hypothetical protein